tara:strand:- start:487 stop:663 length:177 start_codon:yes stop_codon:yes gene_type:complete
MYQYHPSLNHEGYKDKKPFEQTKSSCQILGEFFFIKNSKIELYLDATMNSFFFIYRIF